MGNQGNDQQSTGGKDGGSKNPSPTAAEILGQMPGTIIPPKVITEGVEPKNIIKKEKEK